MEKKASVILGGYSKKANQIQHSLSEALKQINQHNIEYEVFSQLYSQVNFTSIKYNHKEKSIINGRIDELKEFYNELLRKEAELQVYFSGALINL